MKYIFFFPLILLYGLCEEPYVKIVHHTDPDARCLDGTPPALYVHQGNQTDKILIFLEGGGYCQGTSQSEVIQQCYERSKTILGSSSLWPDKLTGGGYLSTEPEKSRFAGWTKIILAYCDGSLHQGHRDEPIKYKNKQLYFRGSKIMKAQLAYINQHYGLSSASKIVWTGGSAGAVGAYLWIDQVRKMAADPHSVYIIPDSGIFLDFATFTTHLHEFANELKNLYKVANLNQGTPLEVCNLFFTDDPWKCFLIQYNFQFLEGKILFINSQYDSWAIPNILKIKCLSQRPDGGASLSKCLIPQQNYIEKYREEYQKVMFDILQITNQNSCWSIGCSNHVYACLDQFYNSNLQRIPEVTGLTAKTAIESFVLDEKQRVTASDLLPYPNNGPCS